MDEPTNHVDVPTREAVTAALARFKGVGLLISHDRALLDALCSQCLFMAAGQVTARPGGYSQGRGQEQLERETAVRQRDQAKRERKRLAGEAQRRREEASRAAGMRSCRNLDPKDHSGKARVKLAVYTGKDGVAGKLSSRMEGRLARAEETLASVKVEKRYDGDLWMRAEPSARKVLHRQSELALALGERRLLVPPLSIGNTDHIALNGPNGAGKSTLVGEVVRRLDPSVRALAIPQEPTAEQCRGALSRLATLDSRSRGRVLAVAAALNSDPDRLVEGDRTSPGEMRKLMLGLGMLDAPELIIMDEPSNYLDLHSVEALERLLAAFPGALLLVSHDAALLEATTSVCWEISESSPETSVLTVGWR
ncbi:ATP-binding cassette domain-containing protein [uncultured Adlercreutzia sp.]|nr:ATP-binding cassette domain-containing protein [uncultured Adlercreutzia sp.]